MLVISPFLPVFISKETTKEFIFLKINFRIAYLVSNYRSQLAEIPVVSLIFAGQLRFFSLIFDGEIPIFQHLCCRNPSFFADFSGQPRSKALWRLDLDHPSRRNFRRFSLGKNGANSPAWGESWEIVGI